MSFICIVCRDLLTNRPDGHPPGVVDIISTKCGHLYHLHCLTEWFRRKVDVANPNHECPYCNAVVTAFDVQRIFPSEDEETEEIAAKFNEAKAGNIDKEINLLHTKLEEAKAKLEEEQLSHENLKFDYTLKLSEMEQMKRDHEVDLSLLDAPQTNWKAMMDKVRKERNKVVKTMTTLEKRFAKQRADLEKEHRKKTDESQKVITELKAQNESMKKKIDRLNALQLQQPFRPVFPTPAAPSQPAPQAPPPVPNPPTSSQRRRVSILPPPGSSMLPSPYCPNVSSASQNPSQGTFSVPQFRTSGTTQSHFLNPPNPAQNPYQNLLSAATASSTSAQSQLRHSPNTTTNQNQNQSSSSSSSSTQNSFSNSNNPSSTLPGQSQYGNFPTGFPMPHPSHPSHHPAVGFHVHYPYYPSPLASRNPSYPPSGYTPFPPTSVSSAHINSSGEVQAAHAQPETSSRALRMMMPPFHALQQSSSSIADPIVSYASYAHQFAIHPAPLSPRH